MKGVCVCRPSENIRSEKCIRSEYVCMEGMRADLHDIYKVYAYARARQRRRRVCTQFPTMYAQHNIHIIIICMRVARMKALKCLFGHSCAHIYLGVEDAAGNRSAPVRSLSMSRLPHDLMRKNRPQREQCQVKGPCVFNASEQWSSMSRRANSPHDVCAKSCVCVSVYLTSNHRFV